MPDDKTPPLPPPPENPLPSAIAQTVAEGLTPKPGVVQG